MGLPLSVKLRSETVCHHCNNSGRLAMLAACAHGRHRSPGALTCAKLGRFVQGIGIPIAQSVSMADWPRGRQRGLFRGDLIRLR
jgi:hypothetical protein